MSHSGLQSIRRINAICGDFESSWRAGQRPQIEVLVAGAEPEDRAQLLSELIALEYELRLVAGETAELSEYERRFAAEAEAVAVAAQRISAADADDAARSPKETFESSLAADRLQLGDQLGAGGMGVVVHAYDRWLKRNLAVKILADGLRDQRQAVARFIREARICARLQHPGIIPVHEMGWLDERPYFAMKLVTEQSLAQLLAARRHPADDLPRWLEIFGRVCETVAYAHNRGIVHRDLKPANVMLGAFGEVYVIDWGLAKEITPPCTAATEDEQGARELEPGDDQLLPDALPDGEDKFGRSLLGTVVGTPAYMSPEQARGLTASIGRQSDVFALGAVLCEILTGAPPYTDGNGENQLQQARQGDLAEAFARLDACTADRDVVDLARDCLAFRPAARPPDASHVWQRLTAILRGAQDKLQKIELERAEARARTQERRRRRHIVLVLAGGLLSLLVLLAGGTIWTAQREAARQRDEIARHERIHRQLAETLEEVDQLYAGALEDLRRDPPRWTRIRELARRAETLAQTHPAGPTDGQRVAALRERILAEDADIRLLERLDQIRLERARVHTASGRYDSNRTGPLYRRAFEDYGLDVAADAPQVAADKLTGRPKHVLEACIFGLESWRAFLRPRVAEGLWIDEVLELIDDNDWRRTVRRACRQKDWPSVERLIATVQNEPPSVDAVNLVAMQLINASQFELAHQLLQAAQPRYPGDFWINQFLGITWSRLPERRPVESIRYYTAALAIRETAATYQNLGGVLLELQRDSEAEQAYSSAARMRPDWVHPHLDLAKLLAELDRMDEALKSADRAVAAAPDSARAASIRGQILIGLGRHEEGLASLCRAVELDDKTSAWYLALGLALRDAGELPEAAECLQRAIGLDAENILAQQTLRDTLTDLGQTDEAESIREQAPKKVDRR